MKSQAGRLLESMQKSDRIEFDSLDDCKDYLNTHYQGHGRIISSRTGEVLQTCKCLTGALNHKTIYCKC